jgi:hypothetical protein
VWISPVNSTITLQLNRSSDGWIGPESASGRTPIPAVPMNVSCRPDQETKGTTTGTAAPVPQEVWACLIGWRPLAATLVQSCTRLKYSAEPLALALALRSASETNDSPLYCRLLNSGRANASELSLRSLASSAVETTASPPNAAA